MKNYKVKVTADLFREGKKFAEFSVFGDGESETAYDAVLDCALGFYQRLEDQLATMAHQNMIPDNVECRVEYVKEVKKNAKSDH